MKSKSLIAIAVLLASSALSAEQGNYLLGPIEQAPASAIDAHLLTMDINGIGLGMSEEEVERVLRRYRNKNGQVHYRFQKPLKECENRSGLRWCVYSDFAVAGFILPLLVVFSNETVAAVSFEAPEGGEYGHRLRDMLASYAEEVAQTVPPTDTSPSGMVWQGGSVSVSIDWEAGKMMYLQPTMAPESQGQGPEQ